jgi:hypothetical protein
MAGPESQDRACANKCSWRDRGFSDACINHSAPHLLLGVSPLMSEIDRKQAADCFALAERLSRADGGKLWGVELYGPMIFVDPATREAVANQVDQQQQLRPDGTVFVGALPANVPMANSAVDWAGVKWTMVLWPLPPDDAARGTLMLHECFHRVQDRIGLPMSDPPCPHLDSLEGRYWLQLEWRALRAALIADGPSRRAAVEDALLFRAQRRVLFPESIAAERALENNEGLAEYTGGVLSGRTSEQARRWAADALTAAEKKDTFVRSFAYASGPAYGLLLDALDSSWRQRQKADIDVGQQLAAAAGRNQGTSKPAADLAELAAARADRYAGTALRAAETERQRRREAVQAEYRRRLVEGPVLRISLKQARVQFNPNNLVPFGELGTVYPAITVIDAFGKLEVTAEGALLSSDWKLIRVPAPAAGTDPTSGSVALKGAGWTLELQSGWRVVRGEREGDYQVKAD